MTPAATSATWDAPPRRMVMAVLPPNARGPLPKIAPLLVRALQESGWHVTQTYWGGRSGNESATTKLFGRLADLVVALSRLAASPGAVLFVNSAHSWRGLLRDVPLLAGARCMGRGSVVLLHGSEPDLIASSPRSTFAYTSAALARCADAVLLLSTEERDRWRACIPGGRYFSVSNPFEATAHRATPVAHEPPMVLYVGRLMGAKGVFDLVAAFRQVRRSEACRLSFVGDGPDADRLRRSIEELGLANEAGVVGYAEGSKLARHYDNADIFVLPSYWPEGFPTVLAEAMDAGLPIVTTQIRGMADHLVGEVNCLFVRPRDPEGLAEALSRLLRDPALRRSMGEANRRKVDDFAPEAVVADYLRALEYAARSHPHRRRTRRTRLEWRPGGRAADLSTNGRR